MDPMAGLGVFMLCNAKCPGGIKGAGILGAARPIEIYRRCIVYCTCSLAGGTLSALNPLTLLSKKEQVTSALYDDYIPCLLAGLPLFTYIYHHLSTLKIPGFGYTL